MSTSRIVLIPKKTSDYKESTVVNNGDDWERDYSNIWNHVIIEGLLGLIVNNHFRIFNFKDVLDHFAKYYHTETIDYQTNLANAFLYSQFIDATKQSYADELAAKLYLDNYYITDDQKKTLPLLHYGIQHANKNKQYSDSLSAVFNLLKAVDIASVINKQDDDKRTVFDLAVEYQNEEILRVLLEKSKTLNISPQYSQPRAFFNFLKKHNSLISLFDYSCVSEQILSEMINENFTIADSLLKQNHLSFLENRNLTEPVFNSTESLYQGLKLKDKAIIRNCLLSRNIIQNLNVKNPEGLTLTDVAVQMKRYDLLCELYNKGADVSRTLAIIGPSGIKQLIDMANSPLSTAQDDFSFRRLLENYQKDASLLESGFSQFVLDILNNKIQKETLKNFAKDFPDLKDRLAKYVTGIIDDHTKDGIGIYLVKQLLTSTGSIFPALEVPRGMPTDLTKTIRNLTIKYADLLAQTDINPEKEQAITFITDKIMKKMPVADEKLEVPKEQIKINNLLAVENTFTLETLNTEFSHDKPNWRYAFTFAGPKEINYLLKQAEKQSQYNALVPILKVALGQDKKHLNQLIKDIQSNLIDSGVLRKMARERKDFSQRILNHLDTLSLDEAYDILDKSLNNKHNPFHVIWSPNNQNTSDPFGKLVWAKYKEIKEKLLKKGRELSISHFDNPDMIETLSHLRNQTISALEYKKLETTSTSHSTLFTSDSFSKIDTDISLDKTNPKDTFINQLNQLIIKYKEELCRRSSQDTEYARLSDKIKICYECLNAIKQNNPVDDIRKKWEKSDTSATLFKKAGLFYLFDNNLANVITDIIKHEHAWRPSNQTMLSAQPSFNPAYLAGGPS